LRVQHTLKDLALEGAGKPEQLPAVLPDDEVGVQAYRLAGPRQRFINAQRHQQFVTDTARRHDLDAIECLRDQGSRDVRDHESRPPPARFASSRANALATGAARRLRSPRSGDVRAAPSVVKSAVMPYAIA